MSDDKSHLSEQVSEALNSNELTTIVLLDGQGTVATATEVATKLVNPYTLDLSRFLPNLVPMTLPRFFETAAQLIADAQERAGTKSDRRVLLTEEYPPDPFDEIGDEVIAYRVLRREPANMNSKGTGRPQRKSTFQHDLQSMYHPNKVITIESRPVDHLIEFSCWAKNNKTANHRALWLETLFVNHAWAFEVKGAERFFWKDRGPDTYMTSGGQRLFWRPINFSLRFREFEVKAQPIIKHINLEGEVL